MTDETRNEQLTAEQEPAHVLTAAQADALKHFETEDIDDYDFEIISSKSEQFHDSFMELWDLELVDKIGCMCGNDSHRSITDSGRAALKSYQELHNDNN